MTHPMRFFTISGVIVALGIIAILAIGAPPSSMDNRTPPLGDAEAAAVKDFQQRVQAYADLHHKLEANVGTLDQNATPDEIDAHRTQLRAAIKTARVGAKRGDMFTPGMETLIRRVCNTKVSGSDDKEVKSAIMDENVKMPSITVNEHYPDGVPVTTMPAQLLDTLPKLPEYMEYHFVGKKLVLVDAAAGVVVDFTPNVLP